MKLKENDGWVSKAIINKFVQLSFIEIFPPKGEFKVSKGINMLGVVTLIIALSGVGLGAYSFLFVNNYVNDLNAQIDDLNVQIDDLNAVINETNSYNPPMAEVYYDDVSVYSIPSGISQTFNYNQISFDNRDAFNLTSDSYTIHEPGFYQVTAQYSIEALAGDFFMIQLLSNEMIVCSRSLTASTNTNTFGVVLTNIFNFVEGDSLIIRVYQYNGGAATRSIFPGGAHNFFAIAKIN